jgi:hypothetical protein
MMAFRARRVARDMNRRRTRMRVARACRHHRFDACRRSDAPCCHHRRCRAAMLFYYFAFNHHVDVSPMPQARSANKHAPPGCRAACRKIAMPA